MGKINLKGVLLGGLLAGVVLNVVDFLLYGVVLAGDMTAAMQALGKTSPGGLAMVWFFIIDLVYGIALVWAYAAVRPRFGAGPATAARAGLYTWVVAALLRAIGDSQIGIMPTRIIITGTVVALVLFPVAAVVGAWLYKEQPAV